VEGLLDIVVIKTCAALLLAFGACVAGRLAERPALVHALWIVVLLELLVPPLVEVGVLPHWIPAGVGGASPHSLVSSVSIASEAAPVGPATGAPPTVSWRTVLPLALGGVWLAGAASVLLLAAIRIRRFARLLGGTTEPPAELQTTAGRLAARLGLDRCPRIRIVPAVISPMLRPRWGSLEILFPSMLLERLERGERDALLTHELAHVRRRDHWVRWLELVAGALFWWHPLVWWARDRLRRVEERCCDSLVLDTLPQHASHYARGLVKTVEFLAAARDGLPSLASGIGEGRDLEERLKMIVKGRLTNKFSRPQRVAVAVAAGALLLVLPTWADPTPDEAAELRKEEARLAASEAGARASLLELEREARLLEAELQQIRSRQRDLELELMHQREELEARRLEAGVSESAAVRMQETGHLEDGLRRRLLEAEAAVRRGDDARAAQLEAQAVEMKVRLEELASRSYRRQDESDRHRSAVAADRHREQILLLQEAGELHEAAELKRELIEWQRQMEVARIERERSDELQALGRQLEMLELRRDRADAAGRQDEAAELARRIEMLRLVIENQERSF